LAEDEESFVGGEDALVLAVEVTAVVIQPLVRSTAWST
jgi:hypothetical protein